MKTYKIQPKPGESLLQAMTRLGIFGGGLCGGTGICGKCTVRFIDGTGLPSAEDRRFFTEEQLRAGLRLACTAYPTQPVTVEAESESEYREIQTAYISNNHTNHTENVYKIAIDIGTTTVAMSLLFGNADNTVASFSCRNSQYLFGSDVISRIKAALGGASSALQDAVRSDCLKGIRTLCKKADIPTSAVTEAAIAGNTVMTQLLLGLDCAPLASSPFRPFLQDCVKSDFRTVFGSDLCPVCAVTVFPAVAPFVGGDITAGLYCLRFAESKEINAFIDLGTNGEIAVGNKDGIYVCSTAAGPAFEGGCIHCGTASITGAIDHVCIRDGKTEITTIGNAPAVGICGTGITELTAELLDAGFMDGSGILCERFFTQGYPLSQKIRFTQNDIRQVQMAKAAVCAGLQTLLYHNGLSCDDIDTLYIAGWFGTKLNVRKAGRIGLLPAELTEKAVAVGNTSLGGAVHALFDENADKSRRQIQRLCTEIPLAADGYFSEKFIANMQF